MQNRVPRNNNGTPRFLERLDRASGELNIVLLVLAIGLAVLDVTCFLAFEMQSALPSPVRVRTEAAVISDAEMPQQGAIPALSPARPVGW